MAHMNKIVLPLRVSKFMVFINYSYLIIDFETNESIIIDPAWEFEKIEAELSRYCVKPTSVLLTHSHLDHVDLAESFAKSFNSAIYMSKAEIDCYDFNCQNLHAFESSGRHMIGSIPVEVYITPGHTAGSVCYGIGRNLFTGDTLFAEGCGLCWGKGASPEEMYHSLNMLKATIPKNHRVYPGHSYGEKPGATFESIESNNIYMNINSKNTFIEFRMRKNQRGLFVFR